MAIKVSKYNSFTMQFSGGTPSELFTFAGKTLAESGLQNSVYASDVSRNNLGAWILTIYFSIVDTTEGSIIVS